MNLVSKKEFFALLSLLFIALAVSLVSTVSVFFEDPIKRYAGEVMKVCEDAAYTPSCYDREIPKLMDAYGISLEEAFQVTEIVQNKDSGYPYCHVLGHNLSAKEASKDLSKWSGVIAKCPEGQCSNGCLHGAFQERFRDENLSAEELEAVIPQLSDVCNDGSGRTFTELERGSCYHALGHLTMYVTKADPEESVELCDRIMAGGDFERRHLCYDGVFMQIFQPLEPEDFALIEDVAPETKQEALALCDAFSGLAHGSCMLESWPLFIDELKAPKGLSNFCEGFGNQASVDRCYYGLFYLMPVQFNFDKSRIVSFCDGIRDPYRGQCFAKAASRHIESDKKFVPEAVSYCRLAENRGVAEDCWREMLFYSRFALKRDSASFNQLCELLPGEWQEQCFDPTLENVILYE